MDTITLTAPDISCHHCQSTIERELGRLDGVHAVSVDIPARQVRVTYDRTRMSRDTIVETLDEEGYPVAQ